MAKNIPASDHLGHELGTSREGFDFLCLTAQVLWFIK